MADDGWRYFTRADRPHQLEELASTCDLAAEALAVVGEPLGSEYAAFAEQVRTVAATDFDQTDLTLLTRDLPGVPQWLNPKAIDSGVPLTTDRELAAKPVKRVHDLAMSLRSLAVEE